jgi:hypothetical protein
MTTRQKLDSGGSRIPSLEPGRRADPNPPPPPPPVSLNSCLICMRYPPQVGEELTLLYPDQREVERLENCSGICSRLTEGPSEIEPSIVYR